jgi:uncharacterized SAM-binding protein YcdF (DUF218 family)
MFVFLSKFIPPLIYPLGLACVLIAAALIFGKTKDRWRWFAVSALVVLFVGGNRWVSNALVRSLEWQYLPQGEIPDAEVIVLLGGGTSSADAPRPMVEVNGAGDRVLYAAKLYKDGRAPLILLSGGNIEWLTGEGSSPAGDMAELMALMGVPQEALLLQPNSQNTYEDALFSSQMLREMGVSRVILVTSAMHMPRSVALFEKQGIDVIPAPVDFRVTEAGWEQMFHNNLAGYLVDMLPNASNLGAVSSALKEYIGMWVYSLRGWI